MKNINWNVRWHNLVFVLQIIGSAALAVLAYMGITLPEISSWAILWQTIVDAVSNPYIIGLFLWTVWCAVNDPTTQGLKDSRRALQYGKPFKDMEV